MQIFLFEQGQLSSTYNELFHKAYADQFAKIYTYSPQCHEGRVPNFEQKSYFAEDETRRNGPLFRRNSVPTVSRNIKLTEFRSESFHGGGRGGRVGGGESEGAESEPSTLLSYSLKMLLLRVISFRSVS